MQYAKITNGRITSLLDQPEILEYWSEEEKTYALSTYEGLRQIEIPDDFDWEHINRYGVNDDGTLTDYGFEAPPEPEDPGYKERIEAIESCLTAMMEGINDA